jgi:hypothetical protein
MNSYISIIKNIYIDVYDWHLCQKKLWTHLKYVTEAEIAGADVKYLPLYARWTLATRFPSLIKYLLIDTTSYEVSMVGGTLYRIVLDKPDTYLKKHLIPLIYQHHDPKMIPTIKTLIREHFDY